LSGQLLSRIGQFERVLMPFLRANVLQCGASGLSRMMGRRHPEMLSNGFLAMYKAVAGALPTKRRITGPGLRRARDIKDRRRNCRRPGEMSSNAGADRSGSSVLNVGTEK
jgi:hypothetical protein